MQPARTSGRGNRQAGRRATRRRESFDLSHDGITVEESSLNANRLMMLSQSPTSATTIFPLPRTGGSGPPSPSTSDDLMLDHRLHPIGSSRLLPILTRTRPTASSSSQPASRWTPTSRQPLLAGPAGSGPVYGTASTDSPSGPTRWQASPAGTGAAVGTSTSHPGPGHLQAMASSSAFKSADRLSAPSPPFDVNNPPSRPSSPAGSISHLYGDADSGSTDGDMPRGQDAIIDITPPFDSPPGIGPVPWPDKHTALDDVCYPDDDSFESTRAPSSRGTRRPKQLPGWPNLAPLNAFCASEVEREAAEQHHRPGVRSVLEPLKVNGRLRAQAPWRRQQEDTPYRFTYFNVDLENTIHCQSMPDLLASGLTFKDLFMPEPSPEPRSNSDSASSSGDEPDGDETDVSPGTGGVGVSIPMPKNPSVVEHSTGSSRGQSAPTSTAGPAGGKVDEQRPSRERPTFWLDVLEPTAKEMHALKKAFGLHPLTVEDIMQQDAREKVELFHHYYFVHYCSFEQDTNSDLYMEPVNMYAVVFRNGILTFHWSMTPHPANVRRRIRQLVDYIIVSADWISYALIDDITDSYAPLIEGIKDEVEDVNEAILRMHSMLDRSPAAKNRDRRRLRGGGRETTRDLLPRSRTDTSSEATDSAPPSPSWTGSLMNLLRRRRRASDADEDGGAVDPESIGGLAARRLSYIQPTTMMDRSDSNGLGIATATAPATANGLTRSGLFRRRPTRPSGNAYRDWHPLRRLGGDEKSDSSSVASGGRAESDANLLYQVGECRRKVMSLFRLLGHKADVIKSFAKRCNERSSVAPRSEIGMYLSDIQDHIVTMTSNLGHYEILLSRAHSNYLAQINIRMTQKAESTNDVLNKLTVLGTIVLPMNIITGMWGMNVLVPGQGTSDSLVWFWCITCGLAMFGLISFFIAKKTYGIV